MLHVAISKEKEFEAEGGFVVGEEKEVFLTVYEKEEEKESKNKTEVESELAYYTIFRNIKIGQPGIHFLLFSFAFLAFFFHSFAFSCFRGCFFDF